MSSGGRGLSRFVGIVLGLAGLALAAYLLLGPGERAGPVGAFLSAPSGARFNFFAGPPALSADGRKFAFVATGDDRKTSLWVGHFGGLPAHPLAGTEGAAHPFWSPDGRSLGFFAQKKLKRVSASGGGVETVCDAEDPRGGSWSRRGFIVFAATARGPLLRVSARGGLPVPVTRLDAARGENGHRWPFFLPDGLRFLYLAQTAGGGTLAAGSFLCAGSLDSTAPVLLEQANSNGAYTRSSAWTGDGYLLFRRGDALLARKFDARSLRLTGEAFSVAHSVQYVTREASAIFAVSGNGLLAYQEGTAVGMSRLVWFDRTGRQLETLGGPAAYAQPRLSPDGGRVAVDLVDDETARRDIWIHDLARHTESRLTSDPGAASLPTWSPDGGRIVFSSGRTARMDLFERPATPSGSEELLFSSEEFKAATDWSPDGRTIAFMGKDRDSPSGWDLWTLSLPDRKAAVFLETRSNETDAQFSPDGKWIAYGSDESGKDEIYVAAFPGGGGKRRVSEGGGAFPRWRRDGTEIFYFSGDRLMAVEVASGSKFEAAAPRPLFNVRMPLGRYYDVSAAGDRFLINVAPADQPPARLSLVRGWAVAPRLR